MVLKSESDLAHLLGERWVVNKPEVVKKYGEEHVNTCYELVAPEPAEDCLLVKPGSAREVAEVLEYAGENSLPVFPRGGGTGLAANAVPDRPGLILALERLNDKIEVDETNLTVTCGAAVTLGDLLAELEDHDSLYFPLHPGDEGAQIGGMAASNAGGVRAVKDGVMRDQIRGLKAALPTGELTTFGNPDGTLIKNNAGYDLMNLMIGSQGTLAVIVEVTLKLKPRPQHSATLVIPFAEKEEAFAAVPDFLQEGYIPMAVEYVDRGQILATADDLGKSWPADEGEGDLMIMLNGAAEEDIYELAAAIEEICRRRGALNCYIAETAREQRDLLEVRSHILPAVEEDVLDGIDITVPRSRLAEAMRGIENISSEYGVDIPMLAHAADGNLHPFLMHEGDDPGEIPDYYEDLKRDLYDLTLELGGTVTGEHGVGSMRREELARQYSEREIELMRKIKRAVDPRGILNPGKIFPDRDL